MKVIDEKGRLFGKINVIDFLAILFLLCIIPISYLGYKVFNQKPSADVVKKIGIFTSVDVYAVFKDLTPEVVDLISVGDKELDDKGNAIGEVLDIVKVESNFIDIKLSETNIITKEDPKRKQVTVKMRFRGRVDAGDMIYKENRIKIGSEVSFQTAEYTVKGTIIADINELIQNMQISNSGFTSITIDILFKNLSPEIVTLISQGDFEVDKNGDTIAKVLGISQAEPYLYKIELGDGNYLTKADPQKKQVQAKMEIMGGVEGNAFYFRGKRIAIDSEIEFNTNKYRIEGVILREPVTVKASIKTPLTIDILFKNLSPEIVTLISQGDFEVDKNGDTIAKVLGISQAEPYLYKIELGDGNYLTKADPQKKQVQAKMEIMGGVEGNAFYFRGKRIAIDSEIEFNTNKYRIEGAILGEPVTVKRIDKKWILLRVKFSNLIPELVDVVKEGDEQIDKISGDLIAKIIKVESMANTTSIGPSEIRIQNNIKLIVDTNPLNKNIILLTKVSCIKTYESLIFKETRVKIGNIISLETDKYDITGTIIDIKDINDEKF